MFTLWIYGLHVYAQQQRQQQHQQEQQQQLPVPPSCSSRASKSIVVCRFILVDSSSDVQQYASDAISSSSGTNIDSSSSSSSYYFAAIPAPYQPDYGQNFELQYQPEFFDAARSYVTPSRRSIISASTRRLLQEAPSACGKLGTLVSNYYSSQGSMYGISISPNVDGGLIVAGAPLNVGNVTWSGGAMLLTSQNFKTCEYTIRPIWKPKDSYKYFGAQASTQCGAKNARTVLCSSGATWAAEALGLHQAVAVG